MSEKINTIDDMEIGKWYYLYSVYNGEELRTEHSVGLKVGYDDRELKVELGEGKEKNEEVERG